MTEHEAIRHRDRLYDVLDTLYEQPRNTPTDVQDALAEVVYTLVDIVEDLSGTR